MNSTMEATPATFRINSAPMQPPEEPEVRNSDLLQSLSGNLNHHRSPQQEDFGMNKLSRSPRQDLWADMDIEQAMSYVLAHKNFNSIFLGQDKKKIHDEPTGNFKPVGSLEAINISAAKSERLWRLEAERFVKGINNTNIDITLPETGIPDGGYFLLMSLAEDLMLLDSICQVFNESIVMEELPGFLENEDFQATCDELREAKAYTERRKSESHSKGGKGTQSTMTHEERQKSIFVLIDFITMVLGRILVYSAPRNSTWCYTSLSCLVKYTTELKVLTKDPMGFATLALKNAEDIAILNRKPNNNQNKARMRGSAGLLARLAQQRTAKDVEDSLRNLYYGQNMTIHTRLRSFMMFVIKSLLGTTLAGAPLTTFEVCSVVYETGLERFRTWVYQDRDGGLQATACQKTIPIARSAFHLLQATARAVEATQKLGHRPPPTAATSNQSPSERTQRPLKTQLHWNNISSEGIGNSATTNGYRPAHRIELHTLAEVVTIMVPLSFASPFVLSQLPVVIQNMTNLGAVFLHTEPQPLPTESRNFKAFFSLFTNGQIDVNKRIGPMNVSSLSSGLMTRDRILLGPDIADPSSQSVSQADDLKLRRWQASLPAEMDCINREMDNWIFEETAVLVSCKFYVWTTMAFATLLAISGVVIGFTVRDRVEAVDPFNITTYCWVLAAFGVLVAKSIRVETWPWRDFLQGHVRCRSVSELYSVTGIAEDFILSKLIDVEETSILDTRGPYNAAFLRKSEGGFSIDRPLTMRTMLLSGLIMVRVSTNHGPSLVCLEVRRGTRYAGVGHFDLTSRNKTKERLCCMNLTRSDSKLPLKRQVIDWNRVVGLYNNEDAVFV